MGGPGEAQPRLSCWRCAVAFLEGLETGVWVVSWFGLLRPVLLGTLLDVSLGAHDLVSVRSRLGGGAQSGCFFSPSWTWCSGCRPQALALPEAHALATGHAVTLTAVASLCVLPQASLLQSFAGLQLWACLGS